MFDRELLLEANRQAARYVIPWDSPEPMPFLRRFWETLRLTWFRPRAFGLAFSFTRRRSGATGFALWCLLVTSMVVIASEGFINALKYGFLPPGSTLAPRNAISFLDEWLLFVAYMAILSLAAILTASLLIAYSAPDRDGERRFWLWWTIARYRWDTTSY